MLRVKFLECGNKRISDVATVDKHTRFQVSLIKGNNEVVGVRVHKGVERLFFNKLCELAADCREGFSMRVVVCLHIGLVVFEQVRNSLRE